MQRNAGMMSVAAGGDERRTGHIRLQGDVTHPGDLRGEALQLRAYVLRGAHQAK